MRKTYTRISVLLTYCLPAKVGGVWTALLALSLFIGSYIWRNYFGGQQDAVFFEVSSLLVLWYIYIFGIVKTLFQLRTNSSSFLIDDIKKISYWLGLCSSFIVHGATSFLLNQYGSAGFIAFLFIFQPGFLFLLGRRWDKWMEIMILNLTGLLPFLLINGYFLITKLFIPTAIWLWLIGIVFIVYMGAIFNSQYKRWMNNPKKSTSMDAAYRAAKKYYSSPRGFDL